MRAWARSARVMPPNCDSTDPIIFYVLVAQLGRSASGWIKKFRDAIAEAAKIVNDDREKAADSISKFTKLPIELVKLDSAEPVASRR